MVTIRMTHIRKARLCSSGTRTWFERHGFPWSDFLQNGIPAQKLLDTGDALALRVVKIAEDEANGR